MFRVLLVSYLYCRLQRTEKILFGGFSAVLSLPNYLHVVLPPKFDKFHIQRMYVTRYNSLFLNRTNQRIVECRDLNFILMSFDFNWKKLKNPPLLLTTSLEITKTTFLGSFISLEAIISLCKRFFFTNIEKILSVRLPELNLQQC